MDRKIKKPIFSTLVFVIPFLNLIFNLYTKSYSFLLGGMLVTLPTLVLLGIYWQSYFIRKYQKVFDSYFTNQSIIEEMDTSKKVEDYFGDLKEDGSWGKGAFWSTRVVIKIIRDSVKQEKRNVIIPWFKTLVLIIPFLFLLIKVCRKDYDYMLIIAGSMLPTLILLGLVWETYFIQRYNRLFKDYFEEEAGNDV